MRDLDPGRAEFRAQRDHLGNMGDVLTVNDEIGGQRDTGFANGLGGLQLARLSTAHAADPFGFVRVGMLKAELNMIEARIAKTCRPPGIQLYARRDQVGVEPRGRAMPDERVQIGARHRLAAGKV